MTGRLAGRTVAITGAGSGLGRALVARFAQEEAEAILAADIDQEALATLEKEWGEVVEPVVADVTSAGELTERLCDFAAERGHLDVMVNNAGILHSARRLHELSGDEFRAVLDVNVMGTFNGMQAALKVMIGQRRGSIINTASVSGLTGWPYATGYCASKGAVIALTRAAAAEYAHDGIIVNAVCPGMFHSRIHEGLSDDQMGGLVRRIPQRRMAEPEEICGIYVFLAGEEASYSTGSVYTVDGGYTAI